MLAYEFILMQKIIFGKILELYIYKFELFT